MEFDIWVDADSVPRNLRPIILKAASRLMCPCHFVADRTLSDVQKYMEEETFLLRSKAKEKGITDNVQLKEIKTLISMTVVPSSADAADNHIVENATSSSLCITHDIPLAARLLEKGCTVIDDRGSEYTESDIRVRLMDRAVNNELRSWGVFSEQQSKMGSSDQKAFADNFDRTITRLRRK